MDAQRAPLCIGVVLLDCFSQLGSLDLDVIYSCCVGSRRTLDVCVAGPGTALSTIITYMMTALSFLRCRCRARTIIELFRIPKLTRLV